MTRFVCIHGHFYQPPRENPWLDEIEPQDSAYPYQNWNERITAECYAPNTASRILDTDNRIIEIVNNYERMSFDFGPTLLSWLERHRPDVYRAIIDADKASQQRFSGHGVALAQAYNHMIMPLANSRDKRTQVLWGIRDFEHRFGRTPEGMWLPETAVDIETLEVISEFGIRFTVLAPHQAGKVRKIGTKLWKDVSGNKVDTRMPYYCSLPSGRSIALFFYDGPVSHDVAFGGLLNNGREFAERLLNVFSSGAQEAQLSHIATDGETFGHHHRFGEMALSYCLDYLESHEHVHITIYGEYLEKFPPTHEVEIVENTSWSCAHGIERWRDDCSCRVSSVPSQKWRRTLRETFDGLRDSAANAYEQAMGSYTSDPWRMRNEYITVILNRSPENINNFFRAGVGKELSHEERTILLKLFELQRSAMLMYTSCGWFFDDISGIEALQVLQYAARALQLIREVTGRDEESQFVSALKKARGNFPRVPDGAAAYEQYIYPAIVTLNRVCAHYALSSLFEEHEETVPIYCYTVERLDYKSHAIEQQGLVVGRARITSNITLEQSTISFCVAYLGGHNLSGRISHQMSPQDFEKMYREISGAFLKGDENAVITLMADYFGDEVYSLRHLFKREQDRVLGIVLDSTLQEIESLYRQIYRLHYPIMQLEKDLRMTLPKVLGITAEFILNRDIQNLIESDPCDIDQLQKRVEEVKRWSFELDKAKLSFIAGKKISSLMLQFAQSPEDLTLLQQTETILRILNALNLDLNLWETQNIHFAISRRQYMNMKERAERGDSYAQKWVTYFKSLEDFMHVRST